MARRTISLVAYGCVAIQPAPAPLRQRTRRYIFSLRDRLSFRLGSLKKLDYRNHEDQATYNLGDYAILKASLLAVKAVCPSANIESVNWMGLNSSHASRDAILVCGSGYFFLDKQFKLPPRLKVDTEFSEQHGLPVIVYGAGVNLPDAAGAKGSFVLPEDTLEVLRNLLMRCSYISVRDEASRALLQHCTDKEVHLIGDPALLLDSPDPGNRSMSGSRPLIGLNLAFHGVALNERLVENFPKYVKTLKRIQSVTGCQFHYMVHYDAEVVIAQMLGDAGIDLRIVRGEVDVLLKGYSKLNLHLGGMLHSCILSASTGTPCIGLAYDIKHTGFFEIMRLPQYCLPTEPWSEDLVVQTVLDALSNEQALRKKIVESRDGCRNKALVFLDHALRSLSNDDQRNSAP